MNPRPPECKSTEKTVISGVLQSKNLEELLEKFGEFLLVDLRRSEHTVPEMVRYIRKFLSSLQGNNVTREYIRQYLKGLNGEATYRNCLASFKVFFRDFLEMPQLVQSFRFPASQFKPKVIPTKEELKRFFEAIDDDVGKALFLFFATTGLRKNEVLSLTHDNIDPSRRLVTPKSHSGTTKHCYLSFYNEETERLLKNIHSDSEKLFDLSDRKYKEIWKTAKAKSGIEITPQKLRQWFCSEMALNGVSDSYINAFCGRTPKSVLARHYLDYSQSKMKQIYEKANLRAVN